MPCFSPQHCCLPSPVFSRSGYCLGIFVVIYCDHYRKEVFYMTIEVNLTAAIFKRFTFFDTFIRRKMWRSPATFAGILGVCGIICYLMHHVDGAVMLGTVLMIVGLGFPATYFITFALSLRKQIVAYGLTAPKKVYTLHLTKKAEGITVENEREHVDYKWENVYHVYRDKQASYLYMSAQRGFILPHTCTDDNGAALWKLLERTLPKQKLTILK